MKCDVRSLMAVLLLVMLSACVNESPTLMHEYQATGEGGWSAADTLVFQIPPVRETAEYRFAVGMRLHNLFPYEGLWLVTETRLSNPDVVLRDTIYYRAMRDNGMPLGEGVNLQQSEQHFATFELYRGQTGEIRLYHNMTREVIPAVTDVGMRVEREL